MICNAIGGGGGPEAPEVTCGATDENGSLIAATGAPGGVVPLCYFYRAPITEDPRERIQGLQISSEYDCNLSCVEDSLSIAGTVLEEVDAEFVTMHCDNDPSDGDGCELVAGVLIEAMVPVDGRTLPGTDVFRSLFCADFRISETAACGSVLGMDFVDGLNGRGVVPIQNLVSIANFDAPLAGSACSVEVVASGDDAEFIRADCNFNTRINVADAASIVSYLFLPKGPLSFDPPCLDACDADDTGEINITDAIFLLNYVFIPGQPFPPDPGPDAVPGRDPTPDDLTCGAGGELCP
jgi:hypothetical protein